MAQRTEPQDSPDDFPTPPWATRALVEHVIQSQIGLRSLSCLEPACGAGHMATALSEYFGEVTGSDKYDYRFGATRDFLDEQTYSAESFDWVITNPPFRLAEEFILKSLSLARLGVAILARTVFLESVGRYTGLFQKSPPTTFAQFSERVPMIKGRLDPKATTATGYAWFVWEHSQPAQTKLVWIPPCRRRLEKLGDYPASFR